MADVADRIKQYLEQKNVMQLATTSGDQLWACNVHYFSDDQYSLYWMSRPDREHSQHIAGNPQVAAAILVHENNSEEPYVIGISVQGTAELMDTIDEEMAAGYVAKLGTPPALLEDMRSGKNPHKFYRLTPQRFVLFDTTIKEGGPRHEWTPER